MDAVPLAPRLAGAPGAAVVDDGSILASDGVLAAGSADGSATPLECADAAPAAAAAPEAAAAASLRRSLGVWDLTAIGVGGTIGAGIFVLPGTAAAQFAGPAVVLSFVLSAAACAFPALCYSELASMMPVSGSAFAFTTAALGQAAGWVVGWQLVLEYSCGAATVAAGFSGYVQTLLASMGAPLPAALAAAPFKYDVAADAWAATGGVINAPAVAIVAAMTVLNTVGTRESALFNRAVVAAKLAALVVFVLAGAAYVRPDNWSPFIPPAGDGFGRFGVSGILRGSAVVMFAYIGFDSISTVAQEAAQPQRTVPIATLASLALCTVLYIAVGAVMTGLAPYTTLDVPDPIAVALEAAGDALLWLKVVVSVAAVCGLSSVIMVLILSQARIFYAMAADGLLPAAMGRVHPRYHTPATAVLVTGAIAAVMCGVLPMDVLSEMVSGGTLLAFLGVCASTQRLRWREPALPRPFRAPGAPFVPLAGVAASVLQLAALPGGTWLRLLAWSVGGAALYYFYGRKHAVPYAARRATLLGLALPSTGAAAPPPPAPPAPPAPTADMATELRRLHAGAAAGAPGHPGAAVEL